MFWKAAQICSAVQYVPSTVVPSRLELVWGSHEPSAADKAVRSLARWSWSRDSAELEPLLPELEPELRGDVVDAAGRSAAADRGELSVLGNVAMRAPKARITTERVQNIATVSRRRRAATRCARSILGWAVDPGGGAATGSRLEGARFAVQGQVPWLLSLR